MYFAQDKREQILSVGDVNRYIKLVMDNDALLSSVSVRGEISNLKYHTSGHLYFTLKDSDAELSAVMFRSAVSTLRFSAKNGMQVTAYGKISIYEKSGKCQLYVSAMLDNGIGNLQLEYERLFKKLSMQGLFDESRKRPLPKIPKCIGIITSPTGAAIRDMINVTGRRWPVAKILLYPSLVQGEDAPESLCRGLECLNAHGECDVIIIGRGGGSIEDLWAFNDERVVMAIANSLIPVISAVGHETDYMLSDFVADRRAPTPSAAAELAVPDKTEIKMQLDDSFERIEGAFVRYLEAKKIQLDSLLKQIELCSPSTRLQNERKMLLSRSELMEHMLSSLIDKKRSTFSNAVGKLEAINPLSILGRGYSIAQKKDRSIVGSITKIKTGEEISIIFSDGEADAQILAVKNTAKRTKRRD